MKKIFLALFLLSALGVLVSIIADVSMLHTVCKPALMITLGLYYISVQREKDEVISRSLMLAIIFSCAGDTLLMVQSTDEKFFMLGLGAFLIAQIFYILTYRQHQSTDATNALQGLQRIRYAFPIVLSGTGLAVILYGRLGDLKLPVLVYATALTVMVLTALFRFGRTTSGSFAMVFGGAILFMISDSLIAINKFLDPLPHAGFWIMATYIAAQYLIVSGLLKHKSE